MVLRKKGIKLNSMMFFIISNDIGAAGWDVGYNNLKRINHSQVETLAVVRFNNSVNMDKV